MGGRVTRERRERKKRMGQMRLRKEEDSQRDSRS